FASAPPYTQNPPPPVSSDQVLTMGVGNGTGCATEPGGADGPGTFGWAHVTGGGCTLAVTAPTFQEDPSAPVSVSCPTLLQNAQQNQVPLLVPVYVSLSAGPNLYALQGFADFVVTGYNLQPGLFEPDWLDSANTCTGTNFCVTGYFVQGVIP